VPFLSFSCGINHKARVEEKVVVQKVFLKAFVIVFIPVAVFFESGISAISSFSTFCLLKRILFIEKFVLYRIVERKIIVCKNGIRDQFPSLPFAYIISIAQVF
jgi:hypothetical protein